MEAEITDHVWNIEEIAGLLDVRLVTTNFNVQTLSHLVAYVWPAR